MEAPGAQEAEARAAKVDLPQFLAEVRLANQLYEAMMAQAMETATATAKATATATASEADMDGGDLGCPGEQHKLWHLFQISALSMAHLYKDIDTQGQRQRQTLWEPFRDAAVATSRLYKAGSAAHRNSFERGFEEGCERRIQDVLEWAWRGQATILREDLIAFLCGKGDPQNSPRRPPQLPRTPPPPAIISCTQEVDLQPFHRALALHGLGDIRADDRGSGSRRVIKGAAPQAKWRPCGDCGDQRSHCFQEVSQLLGNRGPHKHLLAQCGQGLSKYPRGKRNRKF